MLQLDATNASAAPARWVWGWTAASHGKQPWRHVRPTLPPFMLQPDCQSCCSPDGYCRTC